MLLVGRDAKVGGPPTFALRASQGLLKRGHTVAYAAQGGPLVSRFESAGATFHRLWPTPLNRLQLKSLLNREQFDIVHACNSTAGNDVAWTMKHLKHPTPWVLSVHGNLPPNVRDNPCLHEAKRIIVFDAAALKRLEQIETVRERQARGEVQLVPRPVEWREIGSSKIDDSALRVVMVGRLSKSKGAGVLAAIDAVASLQGEMPGLTLSIVGGGSLRAQVEQKCREVNAKAGREIAQALGAMPDPMPVLAGASAAIGAGYTGFEALYHNIPLLAVGYEAYGPIMRDNLQDAIAFNFGDGLPGLHPRVTPELLSDGLRFVLTHFATPQGRVEMEEIRATVERDHSLDAVARRLESVYNQASKSVPAPASPSHNDQ